MQIIYNFSKKDKNKKSIELLKNDIVWLQTNL